MASGASDVHSAVCVCVCVCVSLMCVIRMRVNDVLTATFLLQANCIW